MDIPREKRTYIHTVCGTERVMPEPIFKGYQHHPEEFTQLDCQRCDDKFPIGEFIWKGQ